MPRIYPMELIMFSKFKLTVLLLSTLVLSSCNLPKRQVNQISTPMPTSTETPTVIPVMPTSTTTPIPSVCDNLYYPNQLSNTWEYAGNNTALGDYVRTDIISNSSSQSFTVESNLSSVTYPVDYNCTPEGLTSVDPIQQYLGALLNTPNSPVNVTLLSNSGITLPAQINPGDSWQQVAEFKGSVNNTSASGRVVFNYSAVGFENITVPFGTYNALRVDCNIRIELTPFRILAGTYEATNWMAPNVGIIKSTGTSHIPNLDFIDSLELTSFTSSN
jgi:DUF3108-like